MYIVEDLRVIGLGGKMLRGEAYLPRTGRVSPHLLDATGKAVIAIQLGLSFCASNTNHIKHRAVAAAAAGINKGARRVRQPHLTLCGSALK